MCVPELLKDLMRLITVTGLLFTGSLPTARSASS